MINLKTKEWEIKNIDTIIFDKDGTFIDLHFFWGQMTKLRVETIIKKYNLGNEYFNKLCNHLGYDINKEQMKPDGITALYSRSKIIEIFKKDLEKYNVNITEEELAKLFDEVSYIFYQNMTKYTKPIKAAINFIKKIHSKGIKIGIVTSDSKESAILTLKHYNWEYLFDAVIGRESTPHTKESGIPTKLALELLKSNPKNTVMIGDAPMDFISAKNANIDKTILVATGQVTIDELKKTSKYSINSLDEIELF